MLPGHGTGIGEQAVNDETFHREPSKLQILITVLGNVIGGALLLGGMFVLPQLVAGLLA
jgi:formate/nitrite transporter FocA (FNT family)